MIEQIGGWVAVGLAVVMASLLILNLPERRKPHRDLCKHGCRIVHSATCEDGVIIGGVPFVCERAYSHAGEHEAVGSSGWVASWTDDHQQRTRPSVSLDKMHALSLDERRVRGR